MVLTIDGRSAQPLGAAKQSPSSRPALLIVGGVSPSHVLGSELALLMAEQLTADEPTEAAKTLRESFVIHIIPRVDVDGIEKAFMLNPQREPAGNARRTDDDRDGEIGEDPPNDLNGDGLITMMRVADKTGEYRTHPDDPRVLIKIDREKGETGEYRLLTEGIDDDHDQQFNEDAGDGVSFIKNHPYRYPYFQPHAGEYQLSEPEYRAVADFIFDHPNLLFVISLAPNENLVNVWKSDATTDGGIRRSPPKSDAAAFAQFSKLFQPSVDRKGQPPKADNAGGFAAWVYFHTGRWSLASAGWWPSPAEEKKKDDAKPTESRGAEELRELVSLTASGEQPFVEWTPLENHPDFPGRNVEVGGWKPFVRSHPPAKDLPPLAAKHLEFLAKLPPLLPRLALHEKRVEDLGGGLCRVTLIVRNDGGLATMPEMGKINRQMYPLQVELQAPAKTEFLVGHPRGQIVRIEPGGKAEREWLLRLREGADIDRVNVELTSPIVAPLTIPLK